MTFSVIQYHEYPFCIYASLFICLTSSVLEYHSYFFFFFYLSEKEEMYEVLKMKYQKLNFACNA